MMKVDHQQLTQEMIEESEMKWIDEQEIDSHSDQYNEQNKVKLANMNLFNFPIKILNFKRLQVLVLSNNKIEILPNEISGFPQLSELYLDHNRLKYLHSSFAQLTSLSVLCIEFNLFAVFPNEICNLYNLKTLNVSDNSFTYLPKLFRNLENLQHFTIDWFAYTIPALPTCTSNISLIKQIREACGSQIHSLTCIELLLTLSRVDSNRTQEILTKLFEPDAIDNRNIFHKSGMNNNLGVLLAAGKYYEVCLKRNPTDMNPINLIDTQLDTPLSLSLQHGCIDAAEILLNNFSANPLINGKGRSSGCLFHAVRALNLEMVKFILNVGGGNVDSKDERGNSLLHELFSSCNSKKKDIVLPIATYIIQSGGDINAKNDSGYSVIHSAIQNECSWAIIWAEKQFENRIDWEATAGTFSRNFLEELAIHPKITYPLIRILAKRIDLIYLTSHSSILGLFQIPVHRKLQSISKRFLTSQHIQNAKNMFILTKMQQQFAKQSTQLKRYSEMFCSRAKYSVVRRIQNRSIDITASPRDDVFLHKVPISQEEKLIKLGEELVSLEEDTVEVRSVPPRPSRIVSLKLYVGKTKNVPCLGDDDPFEKDRFKTKEEQLQESINPLARILEQALNLLFEIQKRRPISWRIMVFQLISKCLSAEIQSKDSIKYFATHILEFIVNKQEIVLKFISDKNTQFNNIFTQVIQLALQNSKQIPEQLVKDLLILIRQIISTKPLLGFELANLCHLKLKCQPLACLINLSPSKPQIRIIRKINPLKSNSLTTVSQLANRCSQTSYTPSSFFPSNTPAGILFRDQINQCNIGKLPPRPVKKGIILRKPNYHISEKINNSNVVSHHQEDQSKQQILILKELYSTQNSKGNISNLVLQSIGESANQKRYSGVCQINDL